jgi:peptide/nickel transport system ATP-binding protein
MLELIDISKTYGGGLLNGQSRQVLKDINIQIKRGNWLGITGESGSGKTTIAKIALRLINPSSGSIILDDTDITLLSMKQMIPYRKKMQIVFQHPEGALDPTYSIEESISEALLKSGTPRSKLKDVLIEACAKVNLPPDLLDRYPGQVSGGEVQRAALARVLAFEPDYLFLDEPTSMLDVSVQAYILNLIRSESERRNMGVVFITHDLDIIRYICHDTIVIKDGKVEAEGATDILLNPDTTPVPTLVYSWESQKDIMKLMSHCSSP